MLVHLLRRLTGRFRKERHKPADKHPSLTSVDIVPGEERCTRDSHVHNASSTSSSSRTHSPDPPHTARNALKFSLTTLSGIARNIPCVAMLSSVIDPLLAIADRIEQTAANKKGLVELAIRLDLLTPILSKTATKDESLGTDVVEAVKRELESIKRDLDAADSRGKLSKFFNSPNNASSLAKHNTALTQLIANSTLVTVHEVLQTVHDLESKLLQMPPSLDTGGIVEMEDITGGVGGMGGDARIGGQGGDGEGPLLEIASEDNWKIRSISGGIGGPGGKGIEIGGKGGTGKAPMISSLRRSRHRDVIVETQDADLGKM
ncbi:hypothetical protein C8J57DRAFT_377509 [Mycena rebaudengoi]|nr:hypothetical protein C8J57DRAFT_377509 [Mycena rebaudengoi]